MDRYVLVVDGGGAKFPFALELLRKLDINYSKFDLLCGTSVGGLLCFGLNFYSLSELTRIMEAEKENIFKKTLWHKIKGIGGLRLAQYDSKYINEVLQRVFKNYTSKDCSIKTMSVAYDIENRKPKLFKSHDDNFNVWEVCRATSASPTYFKPYSIDSEGIFVDGGVISNNPSMIALAEAIKLFPNEDKINILSIGCTTNLKPLTISLGGVLNWANDIIDIFMDGTTNGQDYFLRNLFPDINYIRLQSNTDDEIKLDDISDKSRDKLLQLANDTYYNNSEKIYRWKSKANLIKEE